ncbi:MAG: hypothetical protein PHC34_13505 [Candidatus Gastranaerophilales bacterium]|nr:hypothetical protein [Candidatus Gastranaerophilales bacterium]
MEKFKIYSNDAYDFNNVAQIQDFYKLVGKKDVLKKITEANKDKIYMRIVADKSDKSITMSLFEPRTSQNVQIKLPDLLLDYEEYKIKEADAFLDLTEYMEFE